MKDIERAKRLQRSLWSASGREWTEAEFNERWIFGPSANDWDSWYEDDSLKREIDHAHLCVLCGENDLRNGGSFVAGSKHRIELKLCEACSAPNVKRAETAADRTSSIASRSGKLRRWLAVCCSILVWYIFLPEGLINLIPIILVTFPVWYGFGIANRIAGQDPEWAMVGLWWLGQSFAGCFGMFFVIAGLCCGFLMSSRTGLVTIAAAVFSYLVYKSCLAILGSISGLLRLPL